MQEILSCATISRKEVKRLQEERIMRKTKIICTLGPSTDKGDVMETLVREGMDVARFNFSHGTHPEQKERLDKGRSAGWGEFFDRLCAFEARADADECDGCRTGGQHVQPLGQHGRKIDLQE